MAQNQHDVAALMNEVLDILENQMGLSRGTLTLHRPGTEILEIEASRGLSIAEQQRGLYHLGEGVTGKVAETGEPMMVPDISQSSDFLNRTKTNRDSAIAFLCVPIIHQNKVVGTMSIDRPNDDLEVLERDFEFLKLLGGLLAEAVWRIRENREEREGLEEENRRLRSQLGERYRPTNLVGNCGAMQQVYDSISLVATSPATVLIRGESGTGKELVARALHYNSDRSKEAMVCVNCAALPENLIESELFGHEKGSFTGASEQRKGRFELADGGTLFLDEIGDISPHVQVRLLRVLQEKTFERVGGTSLVKVDVRIIAATSRNLEEEMEKGTFREDLFYRLNVFPIHMPPLRERRSDILLLADHFVQKYNESYGKEIKRISTAAINMMMAYHWPGNVRELENCIERAVLTSKDNVIHGYSLPPTLQTAEHSNTVLLPEDGGDLKSMVKAYEQELIIDALKRTHGNSAAAARKLQTTQRILNYHIKQLGINPKQYSSTGK